MEQVSNRMKYESAEVEVHRNHEKASDVHNAILLYTQGPVMSNGRRSISNTMTPGKARDIAAALIAAADDFDAIVAEANDPLAKLLKQLDAAGENAFVAGDSVHVSFIKRQGEWYRITGLNDVGIHSDSPRTIAEFLSSSGGDFTLAWLGSKP